MQNLVLTVILVVQLATLGWIAILWRDRDRSQTDPQVAEQLMQLNARMNLLTEVSVLVDELRQNLQAGPGIGAGPGPGAVEVAGSDTPPATGAAAAKAALPPSPAVNSPPPGAPFAEAGRILAELKQTFFQYEVALAEDETFVGPLKSRLEQKQADLLRRGIEALHWIAEEVTKLPYEPGRDHRFIEFLVREILPLLAAADHAETFKLARQALVTKTNEPSVRMAAARTLRAIDGELWVREIIPVVEMGGSGGQTVALRAQLLQMFEETPRPEIVGTCQTFLSDPRYPIVLRTSSAQVLAVQNSDAVLPVLRGVILEDPTPELQRAALDALYRRFGDAPDMQTLLQEVVRAPAGAVPTTLREKAQRLLEGE